MQFVRDFFAPARATAARARRLAGEGRHDEAVALAERALDKDAALYAETARWRREAFTPGRAAEPWPPGLPDPFPSLRGAVPEIDADGLTGAVMGGAILHHGCLLVRGLVDAPDVARLVEAVDRAFEAARAWHHGGAEGVDTPWYAPYRSSSAIDQEIAASREFTLDGGGVLTPDSPRALSELIAVLHRCGAVSAVADYLGEEPFLSVRKSTLRRVPADSGTGWHQDGAFLGLGIRSVNCWLSLSDCGVDAPGLEIFPRRAAGLFETGTRGSYFDWAVGDGVVQDAARETPTVSPVFAPGDALFFDHLLLHRTGVRPGMTRERLAIETWMFAGSCFPLDQAPLSLRR